MNINLQVDDSKVKSLLDAMQDYRTFIKADAGRAFIKAAREITFALHQEFRRQPPRPIEGRITAATAARGFRQNTLSRSYLSGFKSALRTLGGAKSGYFRIEKVGSAGRVIARPVQLGRRRKVILAGRKAKGQRGSLLTSLAQVDNQQQIPENWRRLNATALANVNSTGYRERAGIGGYLAAQFLTYKKVKAGKGTQRHTVLTKNNLLAGEVIAETDSEGNPEGFIIAGRLPGTARVAQKYGIVGKSFDGAVKNYRADMFALLAKRANRVAEEIRSA